MSAPQRILLVEDEFEIADMLRMFFTLQGYAFYHASDGAEALQLAARILPHAILMDISLPDTDGYALTIKLRSRLRTAHIPILFASKWGSRDKRLAGLALGADDYLTKPYNLQELLLRTQNSIVHAAREYLTDLRTGLPAAFTARQAIEVARTSPERAIIEVGLEHGIPYRNAYGDAAGADVHCYVAQMLIDATNDLGQPDNFVGTLDENRFVILTHRASAHAIVEQVTAAFNDRVGSFYDGEDREIGKLQVNGDSFPLMQMVCRVALGTGTADMSPG